MLKYFSISGTSFLEINVKSDRNEQSFQILEMLTGFKYL